MPDFNAHYFLGQELLEEMPEDLRDIADKNKSIYDLGLQGPDFLYYYLRKPNKIKVSSSIHSSSYMDFLKGINYSGRDLEKAYMMGFSLHFSLDFYGHRAINSMKLKDFSHYRIEMEFDKYMLEERNYKKEDLPLLLKVDDEDLRALSYLYRPYRINFQDIKTSIIWMNKIRSWLYPKSFGEEKAKARILRVPALKKFEGKLMSSERFEQAEISNQEIKSAYEEAKGVGIKNIEKALEILENGGGYYRAFEADFKGRERGQ